MPPAMAANTRGKTDGARKHLGEDLLGRIDEAEQPAHQGAHGQGVAQGDAVGQRLAEAGDDARQADRLAIFGMQGLGQAQKRPQHDRQPVGHQHAEDPAPRAELHDQGADRGGQDGHAQEDQEAERHDPRHVPAAVAVAHDGDHQHPGRRAAQSLADAGRDQGVEGGRQGRQQAEDHVDCDPRHQDRLAAEPVGQRPVRQLGAAEAQQIGGDHPLDAVGRAHRQVLADVRQGRQHGIDGQGVHRHQRRDQADELDEAGLLPGGLGGRRGRCGGHARQMPGNRPNRNRAGVINCCNAAKSRLTRRRLAIVTKLR